jgi:hypothetical protein
MRQVIQAATAIVIGPAKTAEGSGAVGFCVDSVGISTDKGRAAGGGCRSTSRDGSATVGAIADGAVVGAGTGAAPRGAAHASIASAMTMAADRCGMFLQLLPFIPSRPSVSACHDTVDDNTSATHKAWLLDLLKWLGSKVDYSPAMKRNSSQA